MRSSPIVLRTIATLFLISALALTSCWKVDPDLKLSTNELTLGADTDEASVTVTNDSRDNALTSGVTDLEYQFKSDRVWLTVQPVSGRLRAEESTTHMFSIDRSEVGSGAGIATVTVTSNGGDEKITVIVTNTSGECTSAPAAPTGPSPQNGATGVSLSASLSWGNGASRCDGLTASYDVYFGTDNPPPLVRNNGSSKTFDPGTLAATTLYYWRVVAKDANGSTTSASWSFRTGMDTSCSEPPAAPSSLSPPNDAADVPLDQDLSWSGGESECPNLTATYDVYFGTSNPPPLMRNNGSSKSFDPGTLAAMTLYYWRVVARDANGSTASATRSFRTIADTSCSEPPAAPSSLSPPNDADEVPLDQDLSWSGGESECPNLTATYDVYFGTSSPPPLHHNNGSDKRWDPGTLEGNRTYYWRIVAKDANGSRSSGERSFSTACADNEFAIVTAPCTPSPPNGKQNVNTKTNLAWGCGTADECDEGDVEYVVYFGTSSSLGEDARLGTSTTRSFNLPDLDERTTYYWRVVARSGESTAAGPVWNFKTK